MVSGLVRVKGSTVSLMALTCTLVKPAASRRCWMVSGLWAGVWAVKLTYIIRGSFP